MTVFCLSFRILSEVEGGGICFCPCRCLFFVVVCFCCHPERAQRVEGPRRSPPNQNRPSLSPNQSALTAHTSQPIAQTKKRRVPIHSAFFAEWVGYRAVARPGGSRGLQAPESIPSKKRASAPGLVLAVVCFLLVILSAAKDPRIGLCLFFVRHPAPERSEGEGPPHWPLLLR